MKLHRIFSFVSYGEHQNLCKDSSKYSVTDLRL